MELIGFTKALGLFLVLFCINSSDGQVALQSDLDIQIELKNVLTVPKVSKNLSNINYNDPSLPWRLPQNIQPTHYELTITPILEAGHEANVGEQWTTPGSVKISVSALEDTKQITLHTSDLLIQSLTVLQGATELPITGTTYNEEYMHYTIHMVNSLVSGQNYTISIDFIAQIQSGLHGLYRTSYVDPATDETKWIAVTQMEALNARELFPCFDETGFKTVFEVSIGRLEKHLALANGQSIGNATTGMAPGWVLEKFAPTVPMSSYLFAIVISEFEYTESSGLILPDIVVRTYSPKHFIERGGGVYAAEKGEFVMKFYEDYFGQKYPMSKMDMAGVPAFFFGAMENFGLNIYREDALLYFPDESTEAERLRITQVIAHELAHQWFGNLVSPAHWTHVWLNEGVSSFIEFIGIEAIAPEFNGWDSFVTDSIQVAMQTDSVETHPLKIGEVEWYGKYAMDWFDRITYQKGGSIMGMVEGFLTEPVLKKAFNRYQERLKFKAVVQDDLFEDLSVEAELAGKIPDEVTMKQIMDGWTLQTGFPVLNVSRTGLNTISLTQSKYGDSTSSTRWIVPVSYATRANPNFDPQPEIWLLETAVTLPEQIPSWVIVNAGATGYYRVKYESDLEALIIEQLETAHSVIYHRSRSQLLDDYFNFAWQGSLPIETALQFTKYLGTSSEAETAMPVWTTVLKNLKKSYDLFSSTPIFEDFKKYLAPRINRAIQATGGYQAINLNSKGMPVLRHKLLMDYACGSADIDCLDYSLELVNTWKNNATNNPVPHDLRPVVYCGAVAAGGLDAYIFLYSQYILGAAITSKQQNYLLNSFACVSDPVLIAEMLDNSVDDGYFLTKGHGETVLRLLAGNSKARQQLISFLSANVQRIITYFGTEAPIVAAFAELSKYMSTQSEFDQFEAFAVANNGIFDGALNGYLITTRQNIEWVNKYGSAMQQYFVQNA